jgi:hypothetical protein
MISHNVTLSPKKRRAIAALLKARTMESAAELAGVTRRTLFRWMKEDSFVQALRAAEGEMIGEAVRVLIADMGTNHENMRRIRDDKGSSKSESLRASQALDASLLRWREIGLEQRLERIEQFILDFGNAGG